MYLRTILATCLVAGFALPSPAAAQQPAAPGPRLSAAECEVWARELGFAQSVAGHDAAAFREHLHEDVVFGAQSPEPQRGRDAVLAAWAGILDGSAVVLRWYPTRVVLDGSGELAYSSGPALYEDPKTGVMRLGRFGSVWQRGDDGIWRVLFDDGIPPQPADAAAVQRFRDGEGDACPAA